MLLASVFLLIVLALLLILSLKVTNYAVDVACTMVGNNLDHNRSFF